jgi:hypothetical protein
VVMLGPGVASSDVRLSRNGNSDDLLITIDGDPTDSLLIQGQFAATFTGVFGTIFFDRVQALSFSDGTFKTFEDIDDSLIANAEATPGMALYGFAGIDDTLDPGLGGNRFMSAGNNNDTYVFGLGYGNDTILGGHTNLLSQSTGQTVLFNPDVDPSQVRVIRNGNSNDATLVLSDGSTLLLEEQFDAIFTGPFGTQWFDRVQNFQFQDAAQTRWTANDIMNKALAYEETNGGHTIFGFGGFDQTIDPGPSTGSGGGNFFLSGGNNNDTYVFGLGYGNDTILGGHDNILSQTTGQTVLFNPDVDPSQVQVVRHGDSGDVTLALSDGSTLTIENQFVSASFFNIFFDRIDNFQFQDAAHTDWTFGTIMDKAIAAQEAVPGGAIYGFGGFDDTTASQITLTRQGSARRGLSFRATCRRTRSAESTRRRSRARGRAREPRATRASPRGATRLCRARPWTARKCRSRIASSTWRPAWRSRSRSRRARGG